MTESTQTQLDLSTAIFRLNRVLHRLGFQHDAAEKIDASTIEGSFRSEDLVAEGRDCETCDEECDCGEGDRWDEAQAKVRANALERAKLAFPAPHEVSLCYGEKGWFSVSVTLKAKPAKKARAPKKTKRAPTGTVFNRDGRKVEVTIPSDDKTLAVKGSTKKTKRLTSKQATTVEWVQATTDPTGADAAAKFSLTDAAARDRLDRLAKREILFTYVGPTGRRTYALTQEGLALLNASKVSA